MKYTVKRTILTDLSTMGELYRDGQFLCYTLEDKDRGLNSSMLITEIQGKKVAGETCIPYGSYPLVITPSLRFKRLMPQIIGVPGFEGIRIHVGNTDEDVEGCIAVGNTAGQDFIGESVKAFNALFPLIHEDTERGPCEIEIVKA